MDVTLEDKIYAKELRSSPKLKNVGESLQNRRLQCLVHLERMEESAWSSKYKSSKVCGSFPNKWTGRIWYEVIWSDLKERKVSKDLAKDKSTWKSFKKPIQPMQTWEKDVKTNMMIILLWQSNITN